MGLFAAVRVHRDPACNSRPRVSAGGAPNPRTTGHRPHADTRRPRGREVCRCGDENRTAPLEWGGDGLATQRGRFQQERRTHNNVDEAQKHFPREGGQTGRDGDLQGADTSWHLVEMRAAHLVSGFAHTEAVRLVTHSGRPWTRPVACALHAPDPPARPSAQQLAFAECDGLTARDTSQQERLLSSAESGGGFCQHLLLGANW